MRTPDPDAEACMSQDSRVVHVFTLGSPPPTRRSRTPERRSRTIKRSVRAAAPWLALTCVLAALVSAFLLRAPDRPSIRSDPAKLVPVAYESYAVACLVQGDVSPPVDELDTQHFDSIVAMLALVLHTYEQADFGSFLKWHGRDLDFAARTRNADVERIREYVLELNGRVEVPQDWVGALAVYWAAYYEAPPVARFVPETTRIRLTRDTFVAESWNQSFDTFRIENSGNHIAHHLVIPHRRAPEDATNEANELMWMDLAIDFETQHGLAARLIARFVWDPLDGEWFLQRAATADLSASGGVPERRHLIL